MEIVGTVDGAYSERPWKNKAGVEYTFRTLKIHEPGCGVWELDVPEELVVEAKGFAVPTPVQVRVGARTMNGKMVGLSLIAIRKLPATAK